MRERRISIRPAEQALIVRQIGTTGSSRMACMRRLPVGPENLMVYFVSHDP
jgi:hypothetical protein